MEILIKKTSLELKKLFTTLKNRKREMGVIKIDIEGYEKVVLKV